MDKFIKEKDGSIAIQSIRQTKLSVDEAIIEMQKTKDMLKKEYQGRIKQLNQNIEELSNFPNVLVKATKEQP